MIPVDVKRKQRDKICDVAFAHCPLCGCVGKATIRKVWWQFCVYGVGTGEQTDHFQTASCHVCGLEQMILSNEYGHLPENVASRPVAESRKDAILEVARLAFNHRMLTSNRGFILSPRGVIFGLAVAGLSFPLCYLGIQYGEQLSETHPMLSLVPTLAGGLALCLPLALAALGHLRRIQREQRRAEQAGAILSRRYRPSQPELDELLKEVGGSEARQHLSTKRVIEQQRGHKVE